MEIQEAIDYFGNQNKLAEALGIAHNAISNWKVRTGKIPMLTQFQIELGTKGRLKADGPALTGYDSKGRRL